MKKLLFIVIFFLFPFSSFAEQLCASGFGQAGFNGTYIQVDVFEGFPVYSNSHGQGDVGFLSVHTLAPFGGQIQWHLDSVLPPSNENNPAYFRFLGTGNLGQYNLGGGTAPAGIIVDCTPPPPPPPPPITHIDSLGLVTSALGNVVFDTIVGVLPTFAVVLIPIVLLWMFARFVFGWRSKKL